MTELEKQEWRDLLEDYLSDESLYHPRHLTVGNRVGNVFSVSPLFDDPTD